MTIEKRMETRKLKLNLFQACNMSHGTKGNSNQEFRKKKNNKNLTACNNKKEINFFFLFHVFQKISTTTTT